MGQLEEHDKELLLSLKETMAIRKMELEMAETVAKEEVGRLGFFVRFFRGKKEMIVLSFYLLNFPIIRINWKFYCEELLLIIYKE